MELNFFIATMINLLMNLFYTIFALLLGVWALKVVDKKLLTKVDLEEEVKKGNIAAAILASTIIIFVALIVSAGMKG